MAVPPEYVTLVNTQGQALGPCEKIQAHELGLLHAAFSIVIVNCVQNPTHMLLQKRHQDKYHSGALWSNACCGHPRPQEDVSGAAQRRLIEELGIAPLLSLIGTTQYSLEVGSGLMEHEWNHVFLGQIETSAPINPHPLEVSHWKWVEITWLEGDLDAHEPEYTRWLPFVLSVFKTSLLCAHQSSDLES